MKKGFTLIEMLIVICVIGILAAFLFPTFTSVQNRAKEAGVKSVMHSVQTAVEAYNMENGTYPVTTSTTLKTLYDNYLKVAEVMNTLPKNPFTGKEYSESDSAGKIIYDYDTAKSVYTIAGYKKNGTSKVMELTNLD